MAQLMEKQTPPNFDQAAGCYRAALAVRPRSPAAWNNLGNAQKKLNKLDESAACYERAIELDANYFMAHSNLGLTRYKQEKRDDAIASWRKAIELNPKGALNHSNLGHALLDQGKLDEAITCFQTAVILQPRFSVARFNLAAALARQQKLDEAIASYRTAIEIEPNFVLAHQRLAAILMTQKRDYEAAIEVIQKVISLQPQLVPPHQNLGVALRLVGREEEAIASHRRALELQPTYADACISLAKLLTSCVDLQLRNSKEALDLAQKAINLTPQSADAWSALGWAHYRAGNWKASIEALEKSIALEANSSGGTAAQWFFLAMANFQLGDPEAARRWYGPAVEWTSRNQPQNQELRQMRAEAEALMRKD
jgi:superkiller protein 3